MQWNIAGRDVTHDQLTGAGFAVVEEWGVTDSADDEHWVFFSAELDESGPTT